MTDQLRNDLGQPIARLVAILSPLSDYERLVAIRHLCDKLNNGLFGFDSRPSAELILASKSVLSTAYRIVANELSEQVRVDTDADSY